MWKTKFKLVMTSAPILLLCVGTLAAQEEPSACVELGALAYDNWIKTDAGGTGSLPASVENQDYIRCKACHGWDHMGTDGGYVRRSRRESRPNAGAGDGDATSRNISLAAREGALVSSDMILHAGIGRSYSEGTGSWVALDEAHSAANKAAHQNGYTLGNQHPDFTEGGISEEQLDCLAEFLNFEDAAPSAYFANINTSQDPVLYTIVDTADAAAGEVYYADNCSFCHTVQFSLDYLAEDGKFSEFTQKVRWGIPNTSMSRGIMGNPTSTDIVNMMLYLQQEGGTGFAVNPGLTGTWGGGPTRDGEGFMLEFGYARDALFFAAAFYTHDPDGNQAWLLAISSGDGAIDGDTVSVDVYFVEGPIWGDEFDPDITDEIPWGTGEFSFTNCSNGHVLLTPGLEGTNRGFTSLEYDITRGDLMASGIVCPTAP